MADISIRKLTGPQFNPKRDFIAKDESGNLSVEKGGVFKRISMVFLSSDKKQKYDFLNVVNKLNEVFQRHNLRQLTQSELSALSKNLKALRERYLKRINKSDPRHHEVEEKMDQLIQKIEEASRDQFGQSLAEIEEGKKEFIPLRRFEEMKYEEFGKAFGTVWDKHMFEAIPECQKEFEAALKLANPLAFENRIKQIASKYWVKRIEIGFSRTILKAVLGGHNYEMAIEGKYILTSYLITHLYEKCEEVRQKYHRTNNEFLNKLKQKYPKDDWLLDQLIGPEEIQGLKLINKYQLESKYKEIIEAILKAHEEEVAEKNSAQLSAMKMHFSDKFVDDFIEHLFQGKDPKAMREKIDNGQISILDTSVERAFIEIKMQIVKEKERFAGKEPSENEKIQSIHRLFSILNAFQPEDASDIELEVLRRLKVKNRDEIFEKVRSLSFENIANQFIAVIEEFIKTS